MDELKSTDQVTAQPHPNILLRYKVRELEEDYRLQGNLLFALSCVCGMLVGVLLSFVV